NVNTGAGNGQAGTSDTALGTAGGSNAGSSGGSSRLTGTNSGAGGSAAAGKTPGGGINTATDSNPNPPGVTDTTVNVGIIYAVSGAAANAALGAPGITQGDEKADVQILIDDVNAHGGILG